MRKALGSVLLIGVLATAGCTALADGDPSPSMSSMDSTPSASVRPLAVPSSSPTQLAIATFDNTRTPTKSESIAGPAVPEGPFRIEGDCLGDSFAFRLRDATVGAEERDLVSGRIVCGDDAGQDFRFDLAQHGGPVQMVIVDADRATQGWVRAVAVS